MDSPLAVLLRNGSHAGATTRLALKAEQFAIGNSRNPIQVGLPGGHGPWLMDFGYNRPAITVSGLIDNIGNDVSNNDTGFEDMESLTISGQKYYIPYKNFLEKFLTKQTKFGASLEIEVGDATTPISTSSAISTGGGVYECVIGQYQFTVAPGTEDRWVYSLSFPASIRSDIT